MSYEKRDSEYTPQLKPLDVKAARRGLLILSLPWLIILAIVILFVV